MWYISFQGEASGGVNNILVYHDNGEQHPQPNLLPTGGTNPPLRELRGFAINGQTLYVVNAYKKYSQILAYQAGKDGSYSFEQIFASGKSVNSILHPYDLTFDTQGNCYVSSQDSNVVTGLSGKDTALQVASFLQAQYPPPDKFLAGTIVASSTGALPGVPQPPPPDVPVPQGLDVSYTDQTKSRVANSVRGVLFDAGYLYVADEPGNAVKVYEAKTGKQAGEIAGSNLSAPVQLLLNETTHILYIGSTGNNSVVSYDLSKGAPAGTVAPATFIDGKVNHLSGMAFDAGGSFYVAERTKKQIKKFKGDGSYIGPFIKNLPDDPEFILYVPKSSG